MRTYPVDSQESRARVVVLALLADGAVEPVELQLLERADILARLGFDQACLNQVMQEFCEDLEAYGDAMRFGGLGLDAAVIDHLLSEIRDPKQQENLLRAMFDVVHANGHLTDSEAQVLGQAMLCWGLALCDPQQSPAQRRRWTFAARSARGDALGHPTPAANRAPQAAAA